MASKHSKRFFDIKSTNLTKPKTFSVQKPTKASVVFLSVSLLIVFSLIVSSVFVGAFFISSKKQRNTIDAHADIFKNVGAKEAIESISVNNQDIKGWLNIEDTNICYPVCHGSNDTYYLNHNQLGKKSRYGALFLSCNDTFSRNGDDKNIVIFGNNLKDGSMFGNLKNYRNINFYKQHPCIDLYFDDLQEKYIVFSVMLISSHSDDSGDIYAPFKSHFSSESDFNLWLDETLARSIIKSPVEVKYGDDMLTLVTSAKDFENARLVVIAKRTDEWDASLTDVTTATINAKAKYPKIWYTSRGLEYPH